MVPLSWSQRKKGEAWEFLGSEQAGSRRGPHQAGES